MIAVSPDRGDVPRYRSMTPGPDTMGDIEACSLWAGQTVSMVRRVQPAKEIIREIMDEARTVITALSA